MGTRLISPVGTRARRASRRRVGVASLAVGLLSAVLSLVAVIAAPTPASALPADVAPLSASKNFSCAVTSAGGVKCWGLNTSGQLGNATSTSSSVPVDVAGLSAGATVVSNGEQHACAIVSGGAKCWGTGSSGQLGNNASLASNVPVDVSGSTSGVIGIDAGTAHTCLVTSAGAAKCWGNGGGGALGGGSTAPRTTPGNVAGLTSGVAAISAGASFTCAVTSAGGAKCWGLATSGQLGTGSATNRSTPGDVSGLTSGVTAISAGESHACALTSAGAVKCWGANSLGQLGGGSTAASLIPKDVVGLSSGVTAISAGSNHTCAVTSAGAVKCWGFGTTGQLGTGLTGVGTTSTVPVDVVGLTSGATAIAAGTGHSCALLSTGGVRCWGVSAQGELGSGFAADPRVPYGVQGASSGASSVAAGSSHSCALTSGGAVKCWGAGASGRLGTGSTQSWAIPVGVSGLSAGVTALSTQSATTCALTSAGGVKCWGQNSFGQMGNGTTVDSLEPVDVTGLTSGIAAVDAGGRHSCALTSAGGVKCWGSNASGELGTGTTVASSVPVDVAGLTSGVTAISVGSSYTCVLTSAGAMKCWGANNFGQLGEGSTTNSLVPVDVLGLSSGVTDISAGDSHACAVVSGGVKCWGNGSSGRVGDGSNAQSSVPLDVFGLSSGATMVSAGSTHSCAVVSGGVKCWGTGTNGRLGNNSVLGASTPVDVVGLSSGMAQVSAGNAHTCARSVAGGLTCWGSNTSSQLGLEVLQPVVGGNIFYVEPVNAVPVSGDKTVSAPRGVGTQVVLSATDADSDPLTYSVVDQPTKGSLDCNGSFGEDCLYTAGPGQTGADSFTYKAGDGTDDSNVATVSITITNQAPTVDPLAATAPRGVPTGLVLAGADPNSDPLTFAIVTDPSKGSVSCTAAGACTYTADPGTSGTDSFTYTGTDGEQTSEEGTVTFTITNQAPTADDRSLEVGRAVPTPVQLSGADPNGDVLAFEIVDQPGKGSVTCDPEGSASCTYTSTPGANGTDSFTYKASDGAMDSPPATVTFTLANEGPTANDQALEAARGVATPIVLSGADADGDGTTYAIAQAPAKGTVDCTGDGSACAYTAGAGQTGTDSFTFTTSDGAATSAPATVTITITNQAPMASSQTVAANAPTTATPISLTGSDPNGDPVTFAVTEEPAKGTLMCSEVGECTYTARAGVTGTDRLRFTAADGFGGLSEPGTLSIDLDSVTPGVFLGTVDKMEPESGTSSGRGMAVPLTLSQPSPVPLVVWYRTSSDTATGGLDFSTFGTVVKPRSVTIPAGSTWVAVAPPIKDDALVEGDETFEVHLTAVSGGPAYLGQATARMRIRDADSVERADPATPVLSITSVRQAEGNTGAAKGRKAQLRVELSKALTTTLTLRWSTVAGTATAGADYAPKTNVLVTFKPGQTEASIDLAIFANVVPQPDRHFTVALSSIAGGDVVVANATGTVTIVDEDG